MYSNAEQLLDSLAIKKSSEDYIMLLDTAEDLINKHNDKQIRLYDLYRGFVKKQLKIHKLK